MGSDGDVLTRSGTETFSFSSATRNIIALVC